MNVVARAIPLDIIMTKNYRYRSGESVPANVVISTGIFCLGFRV